MSTGTTNTERMCHCTAEWVPVLQLCTWTQSNVWNVYLYSKEGIRTAVVYEYSWNPERSVQVLLVEYVYSLFWKNLYLYFLGGICTALLYRYTVVVYGSRLPNSQAVYLYTALGTGTSKMYGFPRVSTCTPGRRSTRTGSLLAPKLYTVEKEF